jgi:UDP-N-acetyl-D-galactosamine dehydrogenase
VSHGRKLAVIGLGYVGLPVAVAFARQGAPVIGFDIDVGRIAELKAGHDRTHEVETSDLAHSALRLTANATEIAEADSLSSPFRPRSTRRAGPISPPFSAPPGLSREC